ncbi:hypothetical protein [Lysinibacillus sp. SGAir0095]|uniref:hypothetical protein n=1 Tax=Lysinibacillus sp. SGAir0095 TaxID=2070463 RepID=UPI0010CD3228|nr:hypothetical protein [Lysinibacillus sp. SGAir0095]QCR32093.1 hypothetical protein C1N55_07870 [Lysinibacillus sp. SGAir0095]
MSHDKWEDKKIEDLLEKVPKIHDQRSKQDVFNRLKEDGLFDDEPLSTNNHNTGQSRKFKWVPIAVSIAAVFLLAILIPSFINQYSSTDSVEESASTEVSEARDMEQEMKSSESSAEESSADMAIFNAESGDLRTAVYPEELVGNTVFKLGLASDAADSLPVTVLIPNDRIQQDFGDITPTGVELYNHYAPLFMESAIGFSEYHPYAGTITELGDQVIHTLPNDQPYDIAPASLTTYFATLIDTFGDSYEEAALLNQEGSAFEFSEVGEPSTPIALVGESTQYNYFRHTQTDGTTYLAPNFREAFSTVEEAITAMKEETNDIYQSVILPNIDFEITAKGQIATVRFTEEIDLDAFDQVQAMQMIEGILLTAANFDMQVQFENIVQTEWQGFSFTEPLPMPVGANEVSYWTVIQQ